MGVCAYMHQTRYIDASNSFFHLDFIQFLRHSTVSSPLYRPFFVNFFFSGENLETSIS